jgi:hypothetical protein
MTIVEVKDDGEVIVDFTPEEMELLEKEAKRVNKTVEEVFSDLLQAMIQADLDEMESDS